MTLPYKLLALLISLLASFGGGYYYGGQGETKTVTKDKIVTVVQDHIITKTIIRKPDGTTEETTKEEDINHNTTEKSSELSKVRGNGGSSQSGYRIGVNYWFSSPKDGVESGRRIDRYSIDLGRRLLGPVWIGASFRPKGNERSNEVAVSVAVEL